MKRHPFNSKFKVTAVKPATYPGMKTQEVAVALNIHAFMLVRWKKEVREGKLKGSAHADSKQIQGLQTTV